MLKTLPSLFVVMLSLTLLAGCNPPAESGSTTSGPATADIPGGSPEATPVSYPAGETITVNVPDMHCPIYCYPKVKETLTELGGIKQIELVDQKEKEKIDDPRILITLSEELDWNAATKALDAIGFKGATVETAKK